MKDGKKPDKKSGAKGDTPKSEASSSPWLKGVTGVTGVVPPGRRLSPASERRANRWSASGVLGVRPPGKQKVGQSPAELSAELVEKKKTLRGRGQKAAYQAARARGRKDDRRKEAAALDLGRPRAGVEADPFRDVTDPVDFKSFLDPIAELAKKISFEDTALESLGEMIIQSKAPYEIALAFTVLSAIVGKNMAARRRFVRPLERGAKVFYNLSMRLDPTVKPPRGLAPDTTDPLFVDLPPSGYQVPYAYATHAFGRLVPLLDADLDAREEIAEFSKGLRARFIEKRTIGDKALEALFPSDGFG